MSTANETASEVTEAPKPRITTWMIMRWTYLSYLCVSPLVATFAGILMFPREAPNSFLVQMLLIAGVTAVAVYVAFMTAYVGVPWSRSGVLLVMLDGPGVLAVSLYARGDFSLMNAFMEDFFIEGVAIFASILLLATHSPLPTPGQRFGTIALTLMSIGVSAYLLGPSIWPTIRAHPVSAGIPLIGGAIMTTSVNYRLVKRDIVLVDPIFTAMAVVAVMFLWMLAVFLAVTARVQGWFA